MERDYLKKLLSKKDIIYQDSFFNYLKSTSLLEFRKNVNMVQDIRASFYLEEKVNQYYQELLEQYDSNTGLFFEYNKILECFYYERYDFLDNYQNFNYFIDEEMIIKLEDYLHYKDRLELVYSYLKKHTNQKISEIVVDGLFLDNIYNVWLNIKEILRYHKCLDIEELLLDKETVEFYFNILNIDKMPNQKKINMYYKFKDKNIASKFYYDCNLLKQDSYKKIKDNLFTLEGNKKCIDIEKSKKYDVLIYELTGEDFYMMVSCKKSYKDISRARRLCCSLISFYHMDVFSKRNFIYGYTNFDIRDIFHVFEKDICSGNQFDSNYFTTRYVNRIFTLEQICHSKGHNEIQMIQKRCDFGNYLFETIMPSYLVVFDSIEERHILESKRLGIPIVRIDTYNYLSKKDDKRIEDFGVEKFDNILDVYVSGSDMEKVKKLRR